MSKLEKEMNSNIAQSALICVAASDVAFIHTLKTVLLLMGLLRRFVAPIIFHHNLLQDYLDFPFLILVLPHT